MSIPTIAVRGTVAYFGLEKANLLMFWKVIARSESQF